MYNYKEQTKTEFNSDDIGGLQTELCLRFLNEINLTENEFALKFGVNPLEVIRGTATELMENEFVLSENHAYLEDETGKIWEVTINPCD